MLTSRLLLSSYTEELAVYTDLVSKIFLQDSVRVSVSKAWTSSVMANHLQMRPVAALLAAVLLCLPSSSVCARELGTARTAVTTESGYNAIVIPMAGSCATDFSQVSYADVTAACPANNPGANAACCAAFNTKACQYEAQLNDFGTMCPMLFINYLGAAGPYPAGYFVGPCVDGSKGFCIRS